VRSHSIQLLEERCLGCTNCLKVCPVQAIRVRDGIAHINEKLCIDCGECVRVCPYHAHEIITDDLSLARKSSFRVLIVPTSFWGQFPLLPVELILAALEQLGFQAVISENVGFSLFEQQLHKYLQEHSYSNRTYILPNCPAVVRLIFIRFPSLIAHILPVKNTLEMTAAYADYYFRDVLHIPDPSIFYLSTCSAKVTAISSPIGERNCIVKGAFSIKTLFNRIKAMESQKPVLSEKFIFLYTPFQRTTILNEYDRLNLTGVDYILDIFDKLENNQNYQLDLINPYYCVNGCRNGILQVQNPFLAKKFLSRKNWIREPLDVKLSDLPFDLYLSQNIHQIRLVEEETDLLSKLQRLQKIEDLYRNLPHLDCGSCGSPNCYAFAEDVVQCQAQISMCAFHQNEEAENHD